MLIYNLFPLLAGKFNQWQPHLARACEMEFDWVYVNPIQRPGKSSSLYSIADYFDYHPLLVDRASTASAEEQVKSVTAQAKRLGLRMMTDLVINHSAYDSSIVTEHPEWFVREHGTVAHPFCVEDGGHKVVWHDLAQFDHKHSKDREGLYAYFLKLTKHLLALGFDGFRCDAAYMVPQDIWKRLIKDVKKENPNAVFAAETLGCSPDQTRETARCGFDYVFNSAKYWNYTDPWLLSQYKLTREIAPSIAFPESHDTSRLAEEVHGNVDALKQRYLFTALFSGGVMLPMGYEFGFRKKLHVVHTTPKDWETTSIDLTDFISRVNRVKRSYEVFNEDAPTGFHHYHDPNVLLMWKASNRTRSEALVIMNKDVWNRHTFYAESLRPYVQSGGRLECVSPENPMEFVGQPFHYELRPGEAVVLVTHR
jgi:starch synthase (maltosyl-transferring)